MSWWVIYITLWCPWGQQSWQYETDSADAAQVEVDMWNEDAGRGDCKVIEAKAVRK